MLGGGVPDEDFDKGFFVEPTLFVDVDNSMTIAQEEIFGPVLVGHPLRRRRRRRAHRQRQRATASAARVFSGSLERVAGRRRPDPHRHASASTAALPYGADLPFGGYKDSGIGRQNGIAGFDQYLETQVARLAGVMTVANDATSVYYDPYDFEIDADPYPVWRRLRDEAPLYYNEKYDFFALSRFDDVERRPRRLEDLQLRRRARCSSSSRPTSRSRPGSILFEDPPATTCHRGLLSRVFTPRKMAAIEPKVREFCARSLDPLVGSGGFDFIADLGAQMPMRTIGMLLGIPEAGPGGDPRPDRRGPAARRTATMPDRERLRRQLEPGELFDDYIDWRADHPSDDLMTELLTAEFEDETGDAPPAHPRRDPRLHQPHRRRRQRDHHPPDRLDGQGARRAPRPATRARRGPRAGRRNAIEEVLRYEAPSPVQARYVTEDVEHHGQTVPAGQRHAAPQRRGQPRRPQVPRRRPLRHPPRRSTTTCRSATASTSASAPPWPASRAASRSTRCSSASPTWEVDWDNAEQARTSTVRGWERLPVLTS